MTVVEVLAPPLQVKVYIVVVVGFTWVVPVLPPEPTIPRVLLSMTLQGPAEQTQESVDCSPGTILVELAVKEEQVACWTQELFDGGFALQALHAVPFGLHVSVPMFICPQEFGCDEQEVVAPGVQIGGNDVQDWPTVVQPFWLEPAPETEAQALFTQVRWVAPPPQALLQLEDE